MKKLLTVCAVTWAVLLNGCTSPDDAGEEQRAVAVKAVTVELATMHPAVDLIGSIMAIPERTATLSSQIAAPVGQLLVAEAQSVKKGEPLLLLDSRLAKAELAKARAAVDEARANVALLEKGPLPAEIEALRQEVASAAAITLSRRAKLSALEPLHANGEIADVQYAIAQSALTESEALKQAAAQRLQTLEKGTRPELIAQAQAKLRSAESELSARELNVDLCTISAPFDGVVTQLPVRVGAYIERPTVLVTVIDSSVLFARVQIPGDFMTRVHEGAAAEVACDSAGTTRHAGVVTRIGKVAESSSGTVSAFVQVDNSEGLLRPGLACQVRIDLPEIPGAIAVPVRAVADRNGAAVVTLIRDGAAYETEVAIGISTGDVIQIVEGVSAGDVVVTDGGYGLPDGCPVVIATEGE